MAMQSAQNHPVYYYPDGNIVIRCKGKDSTSTFFRIHRGYLSAQSSVIKDMLQVSNPKQNEMHEGVPVIDFSVDPSSMAIFLTFFYQPINDILTPDDPDLAFKLFEVLKLADMLLIDSIKAAIISRIRDDWPATLKEYRENRRVYRTKDPSDRELKKIDRFTPKPASVLRVARQFDHTLLTPHLFYILSFTDPLTPYDVTELPHGQVMGLARWDLVSSRDKGIAAAGRARLLHRYTEQLLDQKKNCSSGIHACSSRWHELAKLVPLALVEGSDPLSILYAVLTRENGSEHRMRFPQGICENCAQGWDRHISALQASIFADLSNFYIDLE